MPFSTVGVVSLIIVSAVGRKSSRKTLLNCTFVIKYGLIPFYLIGGCITISVTLAALFPLPLMVLLGLVTVVFLIFGYGILLGAAPYAIAYLIKSCKEGRHSKAVVILSGICQFLFSFDVFSMIKVTMEKTYQLESTMVVFAGVCLAILFILLYVLSIFV